MTNGETRCCALGTDFDEIYHQNNKNFQPRLGFAWDPFNHGKTVVRGAYAILVDQPMTSVVSGASGNPPLAMPLTFSGPIRLDNAINVARVRRACSANGRPRLRQLLCAVVEFERAARADDQSRS